MDLAMPLLMFKCIEFLIPNHGVWWVDYCICFVQKIVVYLLMYFLISLVFLTSSQ
jgi:hypothetical protein